MKSGTIKLPKADAITIARLSLLERIADRKGIWTFLNERVRPTAKRRVAKPQVPVLAN